VSTETEKTEGRTKTKNRTTKPSLKQVFLTKLPPNQITLTKKYIKRMIRRLTESN